MIAEFRIKKDGQKLENSVIETINNVKLQQCFDSCMQNYQCKSVNFKATNIRTCQLNSKSSVDIFDAVSLTADPKWDFYSSNFSDKLVSTSSIEMHAFANFQFMIYLTKLINEEASLLKKK